MCRYAKISSLIIVSSCIKVAWKNPEKSVLSSKNMWCSMLHREPCFELLYTLHSDNRTCCLGLTLHLVTVINCTVLHDMVGRMGAVAASAASCALWGRSRGVWMHCCAVGQWVGNCRNEELTCIILPDWASGGQAAWEVGGNIVAHGITLDVQLLVTRGR